MQRKETPVPPETRIPVTYAAWERVSCAWNGNLKKRDERNTFQSLIS